MALRVIFLFSYFGSYTLIRFDSGWCLQFNQHLEKTLLVPVAAEPKQGLQKTSSEGLPPAQAAAVANLTASSAIVGSVPNPFLTNSEPILKPIEDKASASSTEWKAAKKPKGPGIYTVVKCGASGHNIRSNPNLMAPPIGMLALGDQVSVLRTKDIDGEVWVQLEQETAEKHCFNADKGAPAHSKLNVK